MVELSSLQQNNEGTPQRVGVERPLMVTHLGPVSPLWTLSRRWSSVHLQKTERQHLVQAKTDAGQVGEPRGTDSECEAALTH